MSQGFYMTLPSNSSSSYYPNNSMSDFSVKLDSAIELQDRWEVGLTEIVFPKSWNNVQAGSLWIEIEGNEGFYTRQRVEVPAGFYRDITDILTYLNEHALALIPRKQENTYAPGYTKLFNYNKSANRVVIAGNKKIFVKFSDDLKFILNLDKSEYHRMSLVKSTGPVYDINADYSVLYVYTSLIADQIVGDTRAPLLRLVCTGKNKHSTTSYRAFPHVQYLPLKFHQFETISVNIRDRLGRKVSFQSGQVVLTVKFRPLRLL